MCQHHGLTAPHNHPFDRQRPTQRCPALLGERIRVERSHGLRRGTHVCPAAALQIAKQLLRARYHTHVREQPHESYNNVRFGKIVRDSAAKLTLAVIILALIIAAHKG
jgi:hypothetical protein